jgi:hypothetical protein
LEVKNVEDRSGKDNIILGVVLSLLRFSLFLKTDALLWIGNIFFDLGWSAPQLEAVG